MSNVFIRASVPEDLIKQWMQHLRDFDVAHPGCHFEVMVDCPTMSMSAVVQALQIDPGFQFIEIFPNAKTEGSA